MSTPPQPPRTDVVHERLRDAILSAELRPTTAWWRKRSPTGWR
ncbi:hypothetical protein AB0F81_41585 [Actinoplanes sp. NPDC024001]